MWNAGGGGAGREIAPLHIGFKRVLGCHFQRAGALLFTHMRDRGLGGYQGVFRRGRHAIAVSALASIFACACGDGASAQNLDQILGDNNIAKAIPVPDVLELSPDQAVWTALAFENPEQLRQLLQKGANPNKPEDLTRMTPLMAAETLQLAWTLIEAGADARARDKTGRTPMHHAVKMREAVQILPLLARAGGDVNARAEEPAGITPLFCAVESYLESPEKDSTGLVVRVLARLGADLNAMDARGATVLAIAAAHNKPDLIKLLVDLGADPTKRLSNGRTPLDYAREANALDAIPLLGGGGLPRALPAN
jgi:ankyrin repeat protein